MGVLQMATIKSGTIGVGQTRVDVGRNVDIIVLSLWTTLEFTNVGG